MDRSRAGRRSKVEENVGRLLLRGSHAFNAELVARLHAGGYPDIRPVHSSVLAHIDIGGPGTRPTVLAQRAGITKQAMGELVADLEALGYVARRTDPTDRRARLVSLTLRGRRQLAEALVAIESIEARYAELLGAEDLQRLRSGIERILDDRDQTVREPERPRLGSSRVHTGSSGTTEPANR
ncbi:MAG: winged helix-turn-helix transcriptional regulator [Chloroflexi bacterium]|nr:winged helix-turn-helix transcriptional regulator [Chloroflexota bacterium]